MTTPTGTTSSSDIVISVALPATEDYRTTPLGRQESATSGTTDKSHLDVDTPRVTPFQSSSPETFKGKSVARWSIDRRRVATDLIREWESVVLSFGDRSLPVRLSRFITCINDKIPIFRNVPYEESFSALLQIIRDAVKCDYFTDCPTNRLVEPVRELLSDASEHPHPLTFDILKKADKLIIEATS